MALEGDLQTFRLPDILQVVSQQQKTGILTVQGEHDILAVSFLRGEIVAADALNQNFEAGLGEVLASQGWVRPDDFARISEGQRVSGRRLADYLVEKSVLSRPQLLESLRQLTYRLLLQVLRWRQGEFKFYSGEEVSYEDGFVPLSVAEVLMRSLGDLMGEGTLSGTLPHGFVAYERVTSAQLIKVIGRDGAPPAEPGPELWVSADEQLLLDRLDGELVANDVARGSGLGEYRTLYGLFRLLQAGLVRPIAGSETAVAPAPETANAGEEEDESRSRRASRSRRIELPSETALASREVWVGRLLAASVMVAMVALLMLVAIRPATVLLPFPWNRVDRAAFEKQQLASKSLAIDRAARTYFLIEGRYPDRLAELADRRLVARRTLTDRLGSRLVYRADALSYVLEVGSESGESRPPAVSETISGDFAIDPDYFRGLGENEGIPLILLD